MTAIQTTVHVGADGVLRLEIPVDERDRDVLVTLTVKDAHAHAGGMFENGNFADVRERLLAAGIRVPLGGSWNSRVAAPLESGGSPVSEALVEDRR